MYSLNYLESLTDQEERSASDENIVIILLNGCKRAGTGLSKLREKVLVSVQLHVAVLRSRYIIPLH